MNLNGYTSYINGLTNMASSCSKTIGPSYMKAECFEKNNYENSFSKYYKIPKEELQFVEVENTTIKDFFTQIFGEEKCLIEGLLHWIHMKAGDARKIMTVAKKGKILDRLSADEKGISLSGFYFLDDIYFVEFDKMTICFMIGNDE